MKRSNGMNGNGPNENGSTGNGVTDRPAPSAAGFLLLDDAFNPIFYNSEAIRILVYPRDPRKIKALDSFLLAEIQPFLLKCRTFPQSEVLSEFLSGQRQYHFKAFSLKTHLKDALQPALALLIERSPQGFIDLSKVARRFGLTYREREAVEFLTGGLTTKEIAARMRISPHTVKAFLRLIMSKMAVSTRSGIIGKLIKIQS